MLIRRTGEPIRCGALILFKKFVRDLPYICIHEWTNAIVYIKTYAKLATYRLTMF